jgi:hypothetical protein
MLSLGFNAAKVTVQNLPDGSPLGPELMVAGAYGDLSSVLQSQVNTVADIAIEAYLPEFQEQCNVIALFSPIGDEAWPYGPHPIRPLYERNGSITINASACVMDVHVGSWEDGGEGDLIVTLLPLQTVVRFPGRRWLGLDTLLQMEEAMVFEDSYLEGDDVISVDVLQLDDQGTFEFEILKFEILTLKVEKNKHEKDGLRTAFIHAQTYIHTEAHIYTNIYTYTRYR